jgi:hypothetical protein
MTVLTQPSIGPAREYDVAVNGGFSPGTRFGDFEVIEEAGQGAMGVVYKARQLSLHRTVALKVIAPAVSADEGFRRRFSHEARLAAAIDHPHVVSVYGAGEQDGRAYIAMQWVEGIGLDREVEKGPLDPLRACTIVAQIAGALDAAAGEGLLHRDVKPPNILLRSIGGRDHAYLTDFGIARQGGGATRVDLTATGFMVGTLPYMAPEPITGGEPDARSDLFSLGCVLYETLTGKRAFKRDTDAALLYAIVHEPRPKPSELIPELEPFDDVVTKALAVDPDDRYQSGSELAAAAFAALGAGGTAGAGGQDAVTEQLAAPAPPTERRAAPPTAAPPATPPPAPAPPPAQLAAPRPAPRRSPALVLVGLLLVAALVAAGLFGAGVIGGDDDPEQPSTTLSADDATTTQPEDEPTTTSEDPATPTEEEDQEAIVGVLEGYADAYTARSSDAMRAVLAEDVTRVGLRSGGCSEDTGVDEVITAYEEQWAGGTGTYTLPNLSTDAVQVFGDEAVAPLTYAFVGGAGGTVTFNLERQDDGTSWLISRVEATCE